MSNPWQGYNQKEQSAEYYLDYGPWAGFFKGGPVGVAWAEQQAAEKAAGAESPKPVEVALPDKTAVARPSGRKKLFWENIRDESILHKDVPFEWQLHIDAIRRQ